MDFYQSLKWFQWLYLNGASSFLYTSSERFYEIFLSVRLDWVTMGLL